MKDITKYQGIIPAFYEWKRCKDTGRHIDSKVRSG